MAATGMSERNAKNRLERYACGHISREELFRLPLNRQLPKIVIQKAERAAVLAAIPGITEDDAEDEPRYPQNLTYELKHERGGRKVLEYLYGMPTLYEIYLYCWLGCDGAGLWREKRKQKKWQTFWEMRRRQS